MIESIAFALVLKKIQIALIALGILVASTLSIYNLPWDGVEWETLTNAIRKVKPAALKLSWMNSSVASSVDMENKKKKTVIN